MTPVKGAPTAEIGVAENLGYAQLLFGQKQSGWQVLQSNVEHVPELTWPTSIDVYTKMRNDGQIGGLYRGATMPIRRYHWSLDPNGMDVAKAQKLADDLGLPLLGQDPVSTVRTQDRFSWDDFLRHVLLALIYGHAFFEQVGYIDADGVYRYSNLAPRLSRTIQQIYVDRAGELLGIQQQVAAAPMIPSNRLASFVWDREGANWVGRSMLRELYSSWLCKDELIRVDVVKHRRNGMGIPVVTPPEGASPDQMLLATRLTQAWRAGNDSGAVLPPGFTVSLVGVQGNLPDTIGSARYHDEAMARNLLMMFMQLGQTATGSRALGGTFIDWFKLGQETIATWAAAQATAHVCEDWTDWNYGTDSPSPKIHYDVADDPSLSVADLVALIEANAIFVDEETEAWLRGRYKMPARVDPPAPGEPAVPAPPAAPASPQPPSTEIAGEPPGMTTATARRTAATARGRPRAGSGAVEAARTWRRLPYAHEVQAAVDFEKVYDLIVRDTAGMLGDVTNARDAQIGQIIEQLGQVNDPTQIQDVAAEDFKDDVVLPHLFEAIQHGQEEAAAEAAAQGVAIKPPAIDAAHLARRAKAVSQVMTDALNNAARAKALQLASAAVAPETTAQRVGDYLKSLSDAWLRDQAGGAVTAAMNAGRMSVFAQDPPDHIYASELMDENTCEPCTAIDGTAYDSLADAEADYPTGGYFDCLGGPRCRGTVVGVWGDLTS